MREVLVSLAGGAMSYKAELFDSGLIHYETGVWSHILKELQHGKEIKDIPAPIEPVEQKRKPGRPPRE